jgi:hypothetical protein
MSRRGAAWLAWSLWAFSLALTALSLVLLALNKSHPEIPVYSFWAENILFSAGFSTVGAVIVPRMPAENPVGWLFCGIGFLWAIVHFAGEYAIYTLGLLVFLGLLSPDGRLLSVRWRWFAHLSALATLVGAVVAAFSPGPPVGLPAIRNPLGIEGLPNAYKAEQVLMLFLIVGAVVALLVRRLYARGVERQQTRWYTYAAAVAVSGAILEYIISEPLESVWLGWVGHALVLIGILGIPISMGIAVTRYRLYEIDLLVNRTLVYGLLTTTLALVYFAGVTATQEILKALTGQEELPQLAVVASTLVIAALFTPLRVRIQSFIDRRFYRSKYDARKTLEAFSAKLKDETDLDRLGEDLVSVVGETMRPVHVGLWLRPDTGWKDDKVERVRVDEKAR